MNMKIEYIIFVINSYSLFNFIVLINIYAFNVNKQYQYIIK